MTNAFRIEVPGQPPSWNQCYRIITLRGHGSLKKTSVAQSYQDDVVWLTKLARPSDFRPEGQLYICYEMVLQRNADADNILKLVNDALARGLDINDSRFLPVVISKTAGSKEPRLLITIVDANHHRVRIE